MTENAFNDILNRIPSLGKNIFLLLDNRDLFSCSKVCKIWSEFIDGIVLKDPEMREKFRLDLLTHLWTSKDKKCEISREFDCELEMRFDDLHQIKNFWTFEDENRLFVSVVIRDKHRSEEYRDDFLFVHDLLSTPLEGLEGCADKMITLQYPLKDLIYAPHFNFLVLHLSCGNYYKDEFEFIHLQDLDKIDDGKFMPEVTQKISIFYCDQNNSLYLLAWEKSTDQYLMLYEMSKDEESFSEHSLMELPEEIAIGSSSFSCFPYNNYFILNSKMSGHVICYDFNKAEELWKFHFPHHNVLCEQKLLSKDFAVLILNPKAEEENAVIRIFESQSGKIVYDFEVPDNFEKYSVRYNLSGKYFIVSFIDWSFKRITVEVFDLQRNKSFRTDSSVLFAKSFVAINSLQILEDRILILTLAESELRKCSLGKLTAIDIEHFINDDEDKEDPFRSINSTMFLVTILPNKKFIQFLNNTQFICQLREPQKSDRKLTKVILEQ